MTLPVRVWVGLVVFVLSLGLLSWANWWLPGREASFELKPVRIPESVEKVLHPGDANNSAAGVPIVLDQRWLSLSVPDKLRRGSSSEVWLKLDNVPRSLTTQAVDLSGDQVIQSSDLLKVYNLMVEARLDLPGVSVTPQGLVTQALSPGKMAEFRWFLVPTQSGSYEGTIWLYLLLISKDGSPGERQLLLARQMNFQTISFLGLPVVLTNWVGALGMLLTIGVCSSYLIKFRKSIH